MAVLSEIVFPGVTALQYEQANQRAGIGADNPPAGLLAHSAVINEDGLRVVNVWESVAAMETFMEIIMPAAQEAGFPEPAGPPVVSELYNFSVAK